jgi:hypothetical protein
VLSFINSVQIHTVSSENGCIVSILFAYRAISFHYFTPTHTHFTRLSLSQDDLQVIHHSCVHCIHNPRCKFDILCQRYSHFSCRSVPPQAFSASFYEKSFANFCCANCPQLLTRSDSVIKLLFLGLIVRDTLSQLESRARVCH